LNHKGLAKDQMVKFSVSTVASTNQFLIEGILQVEKI